MADGWSSALKPPGHDVSACSDQGLRVWCTTILQKLQDMMPPSQGSMMLLMSDGSRRVYLPEICSKTLHW